MINQEQKQVRFAMKSGLLFWGSIALFISLLIMGLSSAVGQSDVLSDIQGLANLYYENRCSDTTNLSYGDLEGCAVNSSVNYALNYNIGLALLGMYGNLQNNQTLINTTIDGLMAMSRLQNDIGDFSVESQDQLQDPTFAPVQVFNLGIGMADAYDRINSNLSSSQKDELKFMFRDLLSWMTISQSTISYQGSGISWDRFSDLYFRKQLNISFNEFNNTDNIHLYFRVDKVGIPLDSNITIYVGSDTSYNYTYNTRYSNTELNEFLQIPLNKSHISSNCLSDSSQYTCNFTFLRNNATWNSTNSYRLGRTGSKDPTLNKTWTSTDGITWTTSTNERIVQLKYYSNTTLDKIQDRRSTANQHIDKGLACYRIFKIINSSDENYKISTNIAQRCYQTIINNILNDQKDGVYGEWNEMYRDFGGNSSLPDYLGYSNHYQWISSFSFMQLYNLTGNSTYLNSMNSSINNLTYMIYGSQLTRTGGIGTRTETNSTRFGSLSSSWIDYSLLSFISMMGNYNGQSSAMNSYIKLYSQFYPNQTYSGIVRYAYDVYPIIYLYENFLTSTNSSSMITDSTRYFLNMNNTGLISIGTANYRISLAYYNNSPSNAIGMISKRDGSYLFLGNADKPDYNTGGLGCITDGLNSSCFDSRGIVTILNNSYPYQINFRGNLTNPNQSIITNQTYNLTYSFYDDSFSIFQSNNVGLNMGYNLTNLSNFLIYFSNGSTPCSNINSCDGNINITLTPNNASYVLDNFNLTEGVSRENSPLWFAQTSLTAVHIASNISAINVTTKINNPGWGENCRFVTELSYTPNGSATQLWQDDIQAQSICTQLTTTGYVLQVNPSTDSNVIRITYSEQSSGGGGTGGSGGDPLGNTDLILCNLTYNYIKNHSQTDYSYIDSIRGNYSWTEFRRYLDNWQPYCSDAIKRTLKEEFVCDKLFYLIVSKPDYSLIEINTLRNQIVNDIQISNNLLLNYADNYETMCKYNKNLPFKREKVGNLTIVKNLTDCSLNTSLSLLGLDYDQISIPLGKIYIKEKSCETINNYKWFVKFERDAEGLFINGIKLGWLISIFTFIAIFLIIKTQFKTKAIEKGLFKK